MSPYIIMVPIPRASFIVFGFTCGELLKGSYIVSHSVLISPSWILAIEKKFDWLFNSSSIISIQILKARLDTESRFKTECMP